VVGELYRSFGLPLQSVGARLASFLDLFYARAASVVITDSIAGKRLLASMGVNPDRVATIPHGVDLRMFRPRSKSDRIQSLYGLRGKKVLLFHGDIGRVDGVDVLLDALDFLGPLRREVRVMVVGGGGTYFQSLRRAAIKRDAREAIFTGWIKHEEMPDYLSVADICVIPWRSNQDTNIKIPGKLVEAMAMGKPVIVSRLDALKAEFKDKIDLLFFEPDNAEDLAAKITTLLSNESWMRAMGRRAEELSKGFSWEGLMRKEVDFLRSKGLLGDPKS